MYPLDIDVNISKIVPKGDYFFALLSKGAKEIPAAEDLAGPPEAEGLKTDGAPSAPPLDKKDIFHICFSDPAPGRQQNFMNFMQKNNEKTMKTPQKIRGNPKTCRRRIVEKAYKMADKISYNCVKCIIIIEQKLNFFLQSRAAPHIIGVTFSGKGS